MADPHWTSYVGMVTGIAGAIMGYVGYRKSNQIKALDLRIELKRAEADIIFSFKKLREQMDEGNKSRMRVLSAIGKFDSGMMEKWKDAFELDEIEINELANRLPDEYTNYDNLVPKELEAKLIESHKIQRNIQKLSKKYSEAMAWDDEQRKHLREDMHTRARERR